MKTLTKTDAATLAKQLPGWLDRERSLFPALERLGIAESELRVLEGDQHLLRILAEESEEQSAEASRREMRRVLEWHETRLERVASEALQPQHA